MGKIGVQLELQHSLQAPLSESHRGEYELWCTPSIYVINYS